jgi:hypothetical protein
MASKTGRRANAASKGKNNAPIEKDDGTRWVVVRDGKQVYPGTGVTRAQATLLNEGLVVPGELVQIV